MLRHHVDSVTDKKQGYLFIFVDNLRKVNGIKSLSGLLDNDEMYLRLRDYLLLGLIRLIVSR